MLRDKANSGPGSSLPQTPIPLLETARASRSSVSRIQVSDHAAYAAPSQLSSNRRAVSADRRTADDFYGTRSLTRASTSQLSAPEAQWDASGVSSGSGPWFGNDSLRHTEHFDSGTYTESISGNDDDFKSIIERELDKRWILNLSLRFRNGKDCEKFFITYLEAPHRWRRVTVTCDYGRAEPDSLEQDLKERPLQGDKNARIYESIRESIDQIEFFETVTNLRLETVDGQLHVNVTEDAHEIITYPTVDAIRHLTTSTIGHPSTPFIPESHLTFEGHFSGFAYQVKYNGSDYVKKEIPGPDDVDEFLYEINALYDLLFAENVIQLKAIVVDDTGQVVKGLLIDFAEKGDLIGILHDYEGQIQWRRRERWARQVIEGVMEIHEAGFVQGDLTVSNVVVDANDDAKIIDINRRGCPVGWEPPEFQPKLENRQRISMYIGVKSDLYQLGMILWAIAMEVDQPERHQRPLSFSADTPIPDYYRGIVQICLSQRPRDRLSAKDLLALFPEHRLFSSRGQEDHDLEGHFVLDSHGSPHQDGTVHPDQIPRSCLDQRANTFQDVSALDYVDDQNRLDPPFEYPHHQGHPDGHIVETSLETGEATAQGSVGPNSAVNSDPGSLITLGLDEDREIDLETPQSAFSFGNASVGLGSQTLRSEDLTFVGSNPYCSLGPANMLLQRAIGTESHQYYPEGSKTTTSDNDIFEMAKETQGSETDSSYARSQMDLLTSSLPINPSRLSVQSGLHHETADDLDSTPPPEGRISPKLRRVTPMTDLNDLFTSHLPINPGLRDEEAETERFKAGSTSFEPANLVSTSSNEQPRDNTLPHRESEANIQTECLSTSILPINPAMPTNMPGSSDWSLDIISGESDPAHLFRLPLNPALYTPVSSAERPLFCDTTTTDIPNSLFSSNLPINPAMPTPPKSLTDEPLLNNNMVNDCFASLLTSKLPLNPAMNTDSPHSDNGAFHVYTQNASDYSSPRPEPQSTSLFDSKLPINPAFIEP